MAVAASNAGKIDILQADFCVCQNTIGLNSSAWPISCLNSSSMNETSGEDEEKYTPAGLLTNTVDGDHTPDLSSQIEFFLEFVRRIQSQISIAIYLLYHPLSVCLSFFLKYSYIMPTESKFRHLTYLNY